MDLVESAKALNIAAAYDNRTVTDASAIVWADALEDLTYRDVEAAIKWHYARTADWLMPAHVRAAVKAIRADRLARVRAPAPNVDPDNPQAQIVEQRLIRDAIADGRMDEAERDRYEAGGWNYLGARPHYALGSAMVTRPAIAAAFGSLFRDARGEHRIPRGRPIRTLDEIEEETRPDPARADHLAAARARLDEQAQA